MSLSMKMRPVSSVKRRRRVDYSERYKESGWCCEISWRVINEDQGVDAKDAMLLLGEIVSSGCSAPEISTVGARTSLNAASTS